MKNNPLTSIIKKNSDIILLAFFVCGVFLIMFLKNLIILNNGEKIYKAILYGYIFLLLAFSYIKYLKIKKLSEQQYQ